MSAGIVLVGLIVAAGYLLGTIPFGLLLTRMAGLGDIRAIGSGSFGATNVLRTGRKGLAVATLLLDAAKGAAAVLVGLRLGGELGVFWGGLAVMLGHSYPVWLGFRGGKGVATGLGALLAAAPLVGLAGAAVWLAVAFAGRRSSLASLSAAVAAPIVAAMLQEPWPVFALTACGCVLVFVRHSANITRLLAGTEPRIGSKT